MPFPVIQPTQHACSQFLLSLLQFCKKRPRLTCHPCFIKTLRIRFWLPQPISFSHFLLHSTAYPSLAKPVAVPWTGKAHPPTWGSTSSFPPSLNYLLHCFLSVASLSSSLPKKTPWATLTINFSPWSSISTLLVSFFRGLTFWHAPYKLLPVCFIYATQRWWALSQGKDLIRWIPSTGSIQQTVFTELRSPRIPKEL